MYDQKFQAKWRFQYATCVCVCVGVGVRVIYSGFLLPSTQKYQHSKCCDTDIKLTHSKSERWERESERVLAFHIANIVILCYTCVRPQLQHVLYKRKGSVKGDFTSHERCQHPISTHINFIFCLSWKPLQYSYASSFALHPRNCRRRRRRRSLRFVCLVYVDLFSSIGWWLWNCM